MVGVGRGGNQFDFFNFKKLSPCPWKGSRHAEGTCRPQHGKGIVRSARIRKFIKNIPHPFDIGGKVTRKLDRSEARDFGAIVSGDPRDFLGVSGDNDRLEYTTLQCGGNRIGYQRMPRKEPGVFILDALRSGSRGD